ncbi:DNA polymerase epsilon subunit 3 isoform X1 [Tribolium castaneum]|uniref:DNA polymerase epsilon subunit 3 n=1 Tax=Tribolium castaneum TaxID=7070 RepID=A0A139WK88_TRICA|nr:PREDICTED: DNA polymerase epsilon subunit 3 isoform X1 [Tribolium castaneum]KYB28227.1 DNA polymerase epsilon subunit 3-like Protein [Tribolium castaneum]|eukprot:XP_967974.1 PREDICTED: DNA polymerase epsilon subunit 3 isoform X1 [Tribolium castaneum]
MAEKLEDLNLPNMTVQKIIKDALPEHVSVGKDARSALSRAASIFVLYITSQATKEAQKVNRKTLLGQDILTALEELEFDEFVEPLSVMLRDFKEAKQKKKVKKGADVEMAEDNDEEAVEEEETGES